MTDGSGRTIETGETDEIGVGSIIDTRYRVDAILGRGGMGCVYRAEHLGIGRTVAIKVLHTEVGADREAAKRFQREALASGRLDHPNIVNVSDFGVLDDGSCYLVMEALEGEPLGERIEREGRLPWRDACEIMHAVLRALAHAHDRGVIHRDIKPDNVFLARRDAKPVVKLLDFGIAKLFAGGDGDPITTRAGLTMGTPVYISPEQAVGGKISPASDIYSASIVLFEMLAGSPPFEEPEPMATMMAHVTRPPPSLDEVVPELRLPSLAALVQQGLEKQPADRVPSAAEYASRLADILRGEIVVPRPPRAPSLAELAEPVPKRWLATAGVVVGALLLLVVILAIAGGSDGKSAAQRPLGLPAPISLRDPELELKAALHDLQTGKTCEDRRAAIPKLVELGDRSVIPDLKRARYRMRGGVPVVGVGADNTNACLKADAEAAIETLGGEPPR